MERFKTLRLIGKRHRIEWDCKPLVDEDGNEVDGLFLHGKKLIRVGADQTHDDERETIIHEILHALEVQMNAEIPEAKLRQLAVGLYAALRDNPKLVTYLLEEEADDAELDGPDYSHGRVGDSSGRSVDGDLVRSAPAVPCGEVGGRNTRRRDAEQG